MFVLGGRQPCLAEDGGEKPPMIQSYDEILEPQTRHHLADRAEKLRLDDQGRGSDRIDIALEKLAKASPRRPIRAPHRLNLISLEELRELVLILGDDAGK